MQARRHYFDSAEPPASFGKRATAASQSALEGEQTLAASSIRLRFSEAGALATTAISSSKQCRLRFFASTYLGSILALAQTGAQVLATLHTFGSKPLGWNLDGVQSRSLSSPSVHGSASGQSIITSVAMAGYE